MAGYPAENGKCCKVYVQEKNNTVILRFCLKKNVWSPLTQCFGSSKEKLVLMLGYGRGWLAVS